MILFFDTETTGKADFKADPAAAHQPRLVQLAALLTEDNGEEVSSVNLIVKPEGFTIPEEASAIHGITTERASAVGVPIKAARMVFKSFCDSAEMAVAHNIQFDALVMDGEMYRAADGLCKWGKSVETFCTMRAMTPICKLPGKYGDYKWPKLQEAHKHAFGTEFDDAHDAMADVRACARVFLWIREQQIKAAEVKTAGAEVVS